MTGPVGQPAGGPAAGPRPASGEQFELLRGDARVVVGAVAAVLREYTVAGEHLTETWPDDEVPPMGAGIVLAPWPNRVEDGRWTDPEGVEQQLDITEVSRNTAIHGLLRWTPYRAVERSADAVTLQAEVFPQHGWSANLDVLVRYALTDTGLRVTHTLVNRGTTVAAVGTGAHPYLRLGDRPIADLTLTVSAAGHAWIDDRWIPQGLAPVGVHGPDLRAGRRLGDVRCDISLTDLAVVSGPDGDRHEHVLSADDGARLTLWTDTAFGWVQLYTPPDFPGRGPDRRLAVAVEPMTCNANALRTGVDVVLLKPGGSTSASWGLEPSLPGR